MEVGLVPHGILTKKVLYLNRKLVGALIDKLRGRVGQPHTRAAVPSQGERELVSNARIVLFRLEYSSSSSLH